MAFFCPGSGGAKIKKEYENHSRRQYDHHHQHHQGSGLQSPQFHRPSSGGYPTSPQVPPSSRHNMAAMIDKVNDANSQQPVSTQFFQKMVILNDHYPKGEMELTVRKGEKVEVVRKEHDWLFVRNERGKEGYIPSRKCVAPVTKRNRSNSRSSIPIRPVMSGEVLQGSNGSGRGRVPMYSSSSAGKVHRYDSPMSVYDFDKDHPPMDPSASFQRVSSPPSGTLLHNGPPPPPPPSDHMIDTKCSLSSSSGVSLMDTSSPGLTRAFSHEDMKPYTSEVNSMYSLSQSAVDPSIHHGTKSDLPRQHQHIHHKHSSSDDSGTVDSTHCRDPVDYASTIRNEESSSEEGHNNSRLEQVSSGSVTPSMRDRPLPSPPKRNGTSDTNSKEETPPPIPPRNTSLDTSRLRGGTIPPVITPITDDDRSPYAQPVDVICNGSGGERGVVDKHHRVHSMLQKQQQQAGSIRSVVDISEKNSGVDSPYSEVYRPHRRPVNVHELRDSGSPTMGSKKLLGSNNKKHRSASAIARKTSPLVNGAEYNSEDEVVERQQSRGIAKFRRYLWGVFICMKDFEGLDENEVSVKAGEQVLVFNQDDQFWYWVVKHKTDHSEGFVPASILREVDDKKVPSGLADHQSSLTTPPAVPPRNDSRQRVHTVSSSLHSSTSAHSHRTRVRSISSTSTQAMANSIEKVPFDSRTTPAVGPFTPSSPPPPYAEQDPINHPSQQSHDSHVTSNHSISRNSTHNVVVRNRPPMFPRTRASTSSQMYPPTSPGGGGGGTGGIYPSYVSQSANRLNQTDRFYQEHQNSYPCSPVASVGGGGTLV